MEDNKKEEKKTTPEKKENGFVKWVNNNPLCTTILAIYALGTVSTVCQALMGGKRD